MIESSKRKFHVNFRPPVKALLLGIVAGSEGKHKFYTPVPVWLAETGHLEDFVRLHSSNFQNANEPEKFPRSQ